MREKSEDNNNNETYTGDSEQDELPDWFFEAENSQKESQSATSKINELNYTDPDTVVKVYALGRVLSQVFEKHGLKYWTSGGTTLGLLRHSGLIPWDDDLDLCIMEDQINLLTNTISEGI